MQTFRNQFDTPLRQKGIKQVASELHSGSMQAGPAMAVTHLRCWKATPCACAGA